MKGKCCSLLLECIRRMRLRRTRNMLHTSIAMLYSAEEVSSPLFSGRRSDPDSPNAISKMLLLMVGRLMRIIWLSKSVSVLSASFNTNLLTMLLNKRDSSKLAMIMMAAW